MDGVIAEIIERDCDNPNCVEGWDEKHEAICGVCSGRGFYLIYREKKSDKDKKEKQR